MSNPFQPLEPSKAPKATETKYDSDADKFIIHYDVVKKVKMTGEKDTDFIIEEEVVEVDRINRQDFLDEQSNDVGILNIIEKVRLSGDETLYNQTHRVSMPGVDKDSLGRSVEDVVDVTQYQKGTVESLEAYKKGVQSYNELDPKLKGKNKLEGVAKLSNEQIDKYIQARVDEIIKSRSVEKKGENE